MPARGSLMLIVVTGRSTLMAGTVGLAQDGKGRRRVPLASASLSGAVPGLLRLWRRCDRDPDIPRRVLHETGANRGRLRGWLLLTGGVGEAGVPPFVVVGEGVVEDAGADLEQQVRSSGAPPHLLLFDHADDLVDR